MRKSLLFSIVSVILLTAAFAVFAAPADQPEQAPEKDPEKVLARVDTQEIKEKEIDQFIQAMGPQGAMYNSEQGRKAILDQLVSMRLLYLSAVKQGLDKSPEYMAAVESFRVQALAGLAIEKIMESATVSDEESKKFYDENPDQFVSPEEVHARHILLSDDVTSSDTVALILGELSEGVSFDALAERHSTDPSAAGNGGDLGFFSKGQMVPEFETAAFALKEPGDLSEPVKSQFGWHIIKLEEKKPASVVPFDDVKPQIAEYLTNEKRGLKSRAELDALKAEYKVEYTAPASGDVTVSGDAK